MPLLWTAIASLALAGPPRANGPQPDFMTVVGLTRPSPPVDVWKVAGSPAPFAWMTAATPLPTGPELPVFGTANPFQQLLDRLGPTDIHPPPAETVRGLYIDPGWWRYQYERAGGLYKRKSKLEAPDPNEILVPYAGRDWKAQEKLQIPLPIPLPVAEQLFVYGQIDGYGNALNAHQTALYGKTGVGLKWSLLAKSELQLRYATLFSYVDESNVGRFQERAQPAVEVIARVPLVGPLEIEYTGAAVPAVARTDTDQLRQELRLALPLRGDNELEFGARYRWDYSQETTPWVDRAQLFLGVKIRH